MQLKKYNKNYEELQDARSGVNWNANSIFEDLSLASIMVRENAFILDIGCRTATVLERFKVLGCENVYGIDIGYQAEEYWKRKQYPFLANLHRGDIYDGLPWKCKFDIITISHVLEHCYDPKRVLEIIDNSIAKNGLIHSIVPIESDTDFKRNDPHFVRFESHDDHIDFYGSDIRFNVFFHRQYKDNSVVISTRI